MPDPKFMKFVINKDSHPLTASAAEEFMKANELLQDQDIDLDTYIESTQSTLTSIIYSLGEVEARLNRLIKQQDQ